MTKSITDIFQLTGLLEVWTHNRKILYWDLLILCSHIKQISALQHAPFFLWSPYKNKWIAVKYTGQIKKQGDSSRDIRPAASTFHHFVHQFSLSVSDRPSGSCTLYCFRHALLQRKLALCSGNYKHRAATIVDEQQRSLPVCCVYCGYCSRPAVSVSSTHSDFRFQTT